MKKVAAKFSGHVGLITGVILAVVFSAFAQTAPPNEPSRDERWLADVRFYAAKLPKRHKNLFFQLTKNEFEREVNTLERRVPKLSDGEIAAELMRITARGGDGHTISYMPAAAMTFFPFRLERFREGWFVTEAADEYKEIVGARLVQIGDQTIERVAAALKNFISADNEIDRESRLRYFFVWSSVLRADGVLKSADTGEFTFEDRDGKMISVVASPFAAEKFVNAQMRGLPNEGAVPLAAKNLRSNLLVRASARPQNSLFGLQQMRERAGKAVRKFGQRNFRRRR